MCANEVWRDAWVEIDKGRLLQNFGEIRRAVGPGLEICAVLKANAAGLGGAQSAR